LASGTTQQRLLAISNQIAQSLHISEVGFQQGPNKLGTVTPVTMTGDTVFTSLVNYEEGAVTGSKVLYRTIRNTQNSAAIQGQRYRTAHG
jgi:hypothetical protein